MHFITTSLINVLLATSYPNNALGGNCKSGFGVSLKSIKSSLLCEKFMDNGQNNVIMKRK